MRIGGLRAAVLILTMTAATLTVANPATADPGASPTGSTSAAEERLQKVSFGRSAASIKSNAANAAGPPFIDCFVYADHPHNSSHVAGTINFIGRAQCTAPIAQIDLVVGLFRGLSIVNTDGRVENSTASTSKNVATPCVAGTYIGNADAIFVAPPGYSPPAIRLVKDSAAVPITC